MVCVMDRSEEYRRLAADAFLLAEELCTERDRAAIRTGQPPSQSSH
jgi:hypothetical protein